MEKRKLLSVVLFCICFAGITLADEVINVDLNAQGDNAAYTGEGAIAGETLWRAIYQGTGVAVGSARTSALANWNEPNSPSVYAAQVWLTIPTDGLFNKVDDGITGNALMDDGFETAGGADPCLIIPGEPQDGTLAAGAYNGTYDIYVYSRTQTNVTLESPAIGSSTKQVAGIYVGGSITAANYVVFQDVVIDDGDPAVAGDGNSVTIIWDDIIDGITLVEKKSPLQIDSSSYAGAPMIFGPNSLNPYDVAKETNTRGGGDQPFGPDLGVAGVDPCDVNYSGPILYYLDNGEYMITDINCDDADAGVYTINAGVVPVGDNDASLLISYYNGATEQEIEIATLTYDNPGGINSTAGQYQSTTSATFNIFAGPGYLKWQPTTPYFNLVEFKLYNISTPPDMPDCDAVYYYHYNYLSDYQKNCRVDAADLLYLLNHWVECYDPNTANCP